MIEKKKSTHRTFSTLGAFDGHTNNVLCNQNHKISECTQLTVLPVGDRLKLVKENRLCFNCLSNYVNLTRIPVKNLL